MAVAYTNCTEMDRDWEDGLVWFMTSTRAVIQESKWFSPNNLVFRHTVHRLLVLSQADWKEADMPVNLLDYVNRFRQCL